MNEGDIKHEYDISEIERLCYNTGLSFARDLFAYILKDIDDRICKSRNKSGDVYYENRGGNYTNVKTLMGPVDYYHHIYAYEYTDPETGEIHKKRKYLLEEKTNFGLIGKMSMNVAYIAAHLICEQSYRQVSSSIENMTGLSVSPQGIWNLIQGLAEKLEVDMGGLDGDKPSEENVKKIARVILEEADGVYIKMRGKDRPENGHAKEMKVAAFYEGFRRRSDSSGNKEYKCVNKRYVVSFAEPDEFFEKKESYLSEFYDVSKIKTRLVNHDGAYWIRNMYRGTLTDEVYFQLDTYHRNKILIKLPKSQRAELHNHFRMHDIEAVFSALRRFYRETNDKEKKKRILMVYKYYKNNKDGLIPITHRVGLNLPELPDGLAYRSLGTMESSVGNLVARRMKHRKAAFSRRGAENLAWLIGLKLCGDIKARINDRLSCNDKIRFETSFLREQENVLSAAAIKAVSGSGYVPLSSSPPLSGAVQSFTRKAIKSLINGDSTPI